MATSLTKSIAHPPENPKLALVDMPQAPLDLKTPEDIVEDYITLREMKGDLDKEQKLLAALIKSWFRMEPDMPETQTVGHHKVSITWNHKHDESAWELNALLAYLEARGLTEVITYRPTIDPTKLAECLREGRITREELQPFVKSPTPVLKVQ